MRVSLRLSKTAFLPFKTLLYEIPANLRRTPARKSSRLLCLLSAILFTFTAALVQAQEYTSIVVFGDSLSDTGNVAFLTNAKYGVRIPGPVADYADGRFTDGTYTVPAAINYNGVWVEQLAAMLPSKPVIKDSLDGGTNYAYGFATTGSGTGLFTFGPTNAQFVYVDNIGQQITDYLSTHPKINNKTLFIVWGGAIDLLYATSTDDIVRAGINQAVNIERLIDAGATQFIVPNLPPLGAVPRLNGSSTTSIPATKASILFNQTLRTGIDILRLFNPGKHLNLYELDVFTLFTQIIASPAKYSLVDVTGSSQGLPVDPDTYLFWDDLHPTTRGHNILAVTAAKGIAQNQYWASSVP